MALIDTALKNKIINISLLFCVEDEVQTAKGKGTGLVRVEYIPAGRKRDSFLVFMEIYYY